MHVDGHCINAISIMDASLWDNVFMKSLFTSKENFTEDLESVSTTVSLTLRQLVTDDPSHGVEEAVACASRLLNLFYILNWTGPPCADPKFPLASPDILVKWNAQSLQMLSWDGEPAYRLSQYPILLYLAHLILIENETLLQGPGITVLWSVRCLFTEQKLLEQRSASLWKRISQLIGKDMPVFMQSGKLSESELCELHLELGHICLYYSQYNDSQTHFDEAQSLAKLTVELTGALGKRTRFQETDIAQLVLKVTAPVEVWGSSPEIPCMELPKDLRLGDDTLLDQIKFADPHAMPQLSTVQQAVILGQCVHLQKTSPVHRLTNEETEAYLNLFPGFLLLFRTHCLQKLGNKFLVCNPKCWAVQSLTLLLRCQLEANRRRTVERAMMQLQALIDAFNTPSSDKELARVLVTLGSIQSALELYQRLEMWEEVIECYHIAGRRGKAEEVVREQLAKEDTPTMWCLLGDITEYEKSREKAWMGFSRDMCCDIHHNLIIVIDDVNYINYMPDPECYHKAWEVSNHRSARAQRSLGMYNLRKEEYKNCIESLQLSLEINSLQENLWFSLGCAASRVEDYDLASKALQRCVALEPDYAEAWNNLAAAYIKRREKMRAFHAYQEAIKCSFDNWRIWENLLVVSLDIGEFQEVVRAYHRLLDLKEKFSDVEVLKHLVGAVVKGTPDRNGQPASRLRGKLGELLGRITSQITSSADVWRLFADYHFASEDSADHDKGLLELQKAQRISRLESGWDIDPTKLQKVVEHTLAYCQACRRVCGCQEGKKSVQTLSSARLALQGVLTKAKSFGLHSSDVVTELIQQLEAEMEQMKEY